MELQLLEEPSALGKSDWNSYYQDLKIPVRHDKKYMGTKWRDNITIDELVGKKDANGNDVIIGMQDGIQAQYLEVNNGAISYSKTWTNARASCGGGVPCFDDPIETIALSIYYGNKNPSIVFAQIMEDSSIHGSANPDLHSRFYKVEQILRRVAGLMFERDGVTVEQNEIVGDYFMGIFGYETTSNMHNLGKDQSLIGLSSELDARKTNRNDNGAFLSNYFSQHCDEYRHRIAPGYVEGVGSQGAGKGPYNQSYNFERNYIQHAYRKVVTYAHGTFEGLNFKIDTAGIWQELPVAQPAGKLLRLSSITGSYDMLRTQTLIGLIQGDRYVIWDDNSRVGKNDKCMPKAYFGGAEDWKNRWKGDNTTDVVQWNPGAAGQPVSNCAAGGFPTNANVDHNGSWAANYLYGQVWDRCNGSLRWPTFSYVEDGVAKTGYFDGNTPKTGVLGAEVSRWGKANIGQNNIVHQYFNGMKPIVWAGTGVDPNKKVWFVLNVNAGVDGVTSYDIEGNTFTHYGDSMGVYIN